MDFDLTEDQGQIKDSVERLLANRYDFDQRSAILASPDGWSRELWGQFADMGLLALPFDEAYGGMGAGPVEIMLLMEAFGRRLVVEPYLSTVLLGGACISQAGSEAQREEFLGAIASGQQRFAFAHTEQQARYDLADVATTARLQGNDWIIDGAKRYVLHGDTADRLIVSARVSGQRVDRDGISLFVVDAGAPGVLRRGYLTQDRSRAADVSFVGVRVAKDALLGEGGAALPVIEQVVDSAIAALCAEAVGAMARAHELTVEYMKVRKQFGVAIGSFQALQHRAVDMLVMVEQARSMALFATMMSHEPDADARSRAVSAAKVQIGRAGKFVGEQAIQLHGGIGVTEEAQVGHYFRRLTMIDLLFGDSAHHLAALAAKGGLISAEVSA